MLKTTEPERRKEDLHMYQWQTPESLQTLLEELVGWDSRSTTAGEIDFAHKLEQKLNQLPYFQQNPQNLVLGDAGEQRKFVAALSTHPDATKTIVLISHFDTVGIEEYGELATHAYSPDALEKEFRAHKDSLSEVAAADLESGDYLWGRGTMDMKAGLAIHMAIVEKAIAEQWPINLVLLTVPDEEVNSAGMRAAVKLLAEWKEEKKLAYALFLNGEPVFSMNPTDTEYKVYSGSIGKIMPSALFYGKETHVGEPLSGMTSSLLASMMTRRMEMNPKFEEVVYGEVTPLPVTLHQKDLRESYSTQTPFLSSALYNVFTMKQSAADVFDEFEEVAKFAANEIDEWYTKVCERQGGSPLGKVRVMRYEALENYAVERLGEATVEAIKKQCLSLQDLDDREIAIQLTKELLTRFPELAPAIVLLFTPPYYPAVNSTEDSLVQACISGIQALAKEKFELDVTQVHYFNGISDLSYVNYVGDPTGWEVYEANTPVWEVTYSIPFKEMEQLKAPVLNVGPFGKDAHKRTERLHIQSAFVETPMFVEEVIKTVIKRQTV
ncbi:M20/M25/M40 family metallo-hydrolase [Chryseomicrobium sp. FSL W7-1435]|uniref:M20/M25/M40 family metallo-hydrolase n=1 Tax=Chryseomicrobium sp. FSL W7-1435 TaxID=2921704 RepID=UPI00315A5906